MTPMKISVFCLAVNLLFASILLFAFHLGPARWDIITRTLSAACNLFLLVWLLRKKLRRLEMKEANGGPLPMLLAAVLAAGLVLWRGLLLWQAYFGHATYLLPRLGGRFFCR